MLVIPALDLRGGRCVRLVQGDYGRETVYSQDPVAVAEAFVAAGAPRLHVVDLDGARQGRPVHLDLITRLAARVPVPVQVGGGIRDGETARAYLEAGVAAVIFGTAAVRRPAVVAEVARRYPGRVLVSLDLKGGRLALAGWTETAAPEEPAPPVQEVTRAGSGHDRSPQAPGGAPAPLPAGAAPDLGPALGSLLASLGAAGVRELIVTDTERDGTLAGADPERFRPFLAAGFRVIAAGGVRDAGDIRRLREAGLWGVIAGRALYEGTLDLAEALAVAREGEDRC